MFNLPYDPPAEGSRDRRFVNPRGSTRCSATTGVTRRGWGSTSPTGFDGNRELRFGPGVGDDEDGPSWKSKLAISAAVILRHQERVGHQVAVGVAQRIEAVVVTPAAAAGVERVVGEFAVDGRPNAPLG